MDNSSSTYHRRCGRMFLEHSVDAFTCVNKSDDNDNAAAAATDDAADDDDNDDDDDDDAVDTGQCLPGSFSTTGLESCETCALGYYQPHYAETSCMACPAGMTTWRRGTRQLDQCRGLSGRLYLSQMLVINVLVVVVII